MRQHAHTAQPQVTNSRETKSLETREVQTGRQRTEPERAETERPWHIMQQAKENRMRKNPRAHADKASGAFTHSPRTGLTASRSKQQALW